MGVRFCFHFHLHYVTHLALKLFNLPPPKAPAHDAAPVPHKLGQFRRGSLLSAKPAADPALGLRSLLLDGLVEGVDLLHRVSLGLLAVCFHLPLGFGQLGTGLVGLHESGCVLVRDWENGVGIRSIGELGR